MNLQSPALQAIYFSPTANCNLKCSHCWINPAYSGEKCLRPEELSMKEIHSFLKEAIGMGLKYVKLTGGEPFLRKDIIEILGTIHDSGLGLQIETNATLLDPEIASFLGKIRLKDPRFFISVSLDGDEKAHDKRRGVKGCYKETLKGVHLLLDQGISAQIIFSAARDNLATFPHILEIAERVRAHSIKINFINDIERAKSMKGDSLLLSVKEILSFHSALPAHPLKIVTNLPPAFKPIKGFKEGGRCGVMGILGILSDGSVSLCGIGTSTPELVAGNVKRDSLSDLWKNAGIFCRLREEVPTQFEGICGRCMLKSFCLGECRADAFYKTGSFKASFDFCERAFCDGLFPKKWILEESNEGDKNSQVEHKDKTAPLPAKIP